MGRGGQNRKEVILSKSKEEDDLTKSSKRDENRNSMIIEERRMKGEKSIIENETERDGERHANRGDRLRRTNSEEGFEEDQKFQRMKERDREDPSRRHSEIFRPGGKGDPERDRNFIADRNYDSYDKERHRYPRESREQRDQKTSYGHERTFIREEIIDADRRNRRNLENYRYSGVRESREIQRDMNYERSKNK